MNGNKLKQAIQNLSKEDKFIVFLPFIFIIPGGLVGFFLALVISFVHYKLVKKYRGQKKYIYCLISFLFASFLFGILLSISSTFLQEVIKVPSP